MNKEKIIKSLNQILEMELAGVVRYTHYALMVCGYSRIPIIGWLRGQATESLDHANQAGELNYNPWWSPLTWYWSFIRIS